MRGKCNPLHIPMQKELRPNVINQPAEKDAGTASWSRVTLQPPLLGRSGARQIMSTGVDAGLHNNVTEAPTRPQGQQPAARVSGSKCSISRQQWTQYNHILERTPGRIGTPGSPLMARDHDPLTTAGLWAESSRLQFVGSHARLSWDAMVGRQLPLVAAMRLHEPKTPTRTRWKRRVDPNQASRCRARNPNEVMVPTAAPYLLDSSPTLILGWVNNTAHLHTRGGSPPCTCVHSSSQDLGPQALFSASPPPSAPDASTGKFPMAISMASAESRSTPRSNSEHRRP